MWGKTFFFKVSTNVAPSFYMIVMITLSRAHAQDDVICNNMYALVVV